MWETKPESCDRNKKDSNEKVFFFFFFGFPKLKTEDLLEKENDFDNRK